ncbi:flagellar hook-length control protein FliK [Pseudoalteromonas espejiana]
MLLNLRPTSAALSSETASQAQESIIVSDAKIDALNNDGLTTKSNNGIHSIKQLLNEFAVQNEETATSEEPTIQLQLKTLSSTEKQALLNQLNNYVSAEQPSGKTLDKVNESIKDLQALIEAEQNQTKVLPAASNTSSILIAEQINGSVVANSITPPVNNDAQSSVKLQSLQTSDASIDDFDALNKELQQQSLAKESNSQAALPRVAQVFSLIMNGLNSTQEQINTQYDSLSYEQSIIESQALQSQQLQTNSAQVKQVNIDVSMMQAINIVKSDAAKMLQERVSSMLSISNKEAEIRLDPPEMGSMQIRIRSDAEQAQINFVVQNQQAKEALEQSMPRLREMLAEQGIDLGESSISYGQSSGDENEQNAEHSQEQMANKNTEQDKNDELVGANLQSSRQQTSSSIDYYA